MNKQQPIDDVTEALTTALDEAESYLSYAQQLTSASSLLLNTIPNFDPAALAAHVTSAKAALLQAAARLTEFEGVFAAPRSPQPSGADNIDPGFAVPARGHR